MFMLETFSWGQFQCLLYENFINYILNQVKHQETLE